MWPSLFVLRYDILPSLSQNMAACTDRSPTARKLVFRTLSWRRYRQKIQSWEIARSSGSYNLSDLGKKWSIKNIIGILTNYEFACWQYFPKKIETHKFANNFSFYLFIKFLRNFELFCCQRYELALKCSYPWSDFFQTWVSHLSILTLPVPKSKTWLWSWS